MLPLPFTYVFGLFSPTNFLRHAEKLSCGSLYYLFIWFGVFMYFECFWTLETHNLQTKRVISILCRFCLSPWSLKFHGHTPSSLGHGITPPLISCKPMSKHLPVIKGLSLDDVIFSSLTTEGDRCIVYSDSKL